MKKITICAEIQNNNFIDATYEIISKAYELKEKAKTIKPEENIIIEAIGINSHLEAKSIKNAYLAGASKVTLLKTEFKNDIFEINTNYDIQENSDLESSQTTQDARILHLNEYAQILTQHLLQNPTDILLFCATEEGRIFAPKISVGLNTGLVADCTELDIMLDKNNDLKLAATRPTFGSELMATILTKTTPECATVRPNVFKSDFSKNIEGDYFEEPVEIIESVNAKPVKLLRTYTEPSNSQKIDYKGAKVILCAGGGLMGKNNAYFEKLKEIARLTNSKYAVSRKVVDYGIEDHCFQVGQTGATVEPEIYITFGVSGALQHIQGMKNSKTIIAINIDENAEIFKYADYKILSDAKTVIDDILKILK